MSIQHLINSYTPKTRDVVFGVKDKSDESGQTFLEEHLKVIFVENGDMELSKSKAFELLNLLDGSLKAKTVKRKNEEGKEVSDIDLDLDFAKIIGNINSSAMKSVEQFILKNCKLFLKHDGEWLQVDTAKKDEINYVFNLHADHYLNFQMEGIKFHFVKFLPSGTGLLANLANKAVNKMLIEKPVN